MSDNQQAAVAAVAATHDGATMMGFQNLASFEFMQRAAKLFATSTMVPAAYQAVVSKGYGQKKTWEQNDAALPNCMVALDLAQRMNASPLQVMQNLHVIEGRPSWASAFIIAQINNSGHYQHGLRYKFEWLGEKEVAYTVVEWEFGEKREIAKTIRINDARCVAWTRDKSGEVIESSPVTLEMAVQEGWYTRSGSKWRTMPEQMAMYRAAAFFGRTYNPELLMGLLTTDEVHDIIDVVPQADGSLAMESADAPAASAMPRAPRAKVAQVAQVAQVAEVVAQAAQAPAAEPEPEPEAPAPVAQATPEPAAVEGVDMDTGEVIDPNIDTRTLSLFESEPVAETTPPPSCNPLPEKKPAARAPKATPAPAAEAPAPTPPPSPTGAPALAPAKIAFVKAQLDTTGGRTTEQFVAKFGITPDELTVPQFPPVLEWFREK